MRLFDSHSHIQFSEFDADRGAVLDRAGLAGLAGVLVLGTDVASSEQAIALADSDSLVVAAAGAHPHDAGSIDDRSLRKLADLAEAPSVVAVGEIGLDFYRSYSPHDSQLSVFRQQLDTAARLDKPVVIHCREAQETLFPILEGWSRTRGGRLPDGRALGVMHYFSGNADLAGCYVELGFLISIHCSVTYPRAEVLQDVARRVTLDALVVETDSPYGAPQAHRGKRNEPAYVADVVAKIAELRNEKPGRVAEATTQNAQRLFGLENTR